MRDVIALLDQAIESESNEGCLQFVRKFLKKFNKFWADTSTWCFEIEVHLDPVSAGKQMGKRWLGFFDESPAKWRSICSKAASEAEVRSKFLENMGECIAF